MKRRSRHPIVIDRNATALEVMAALDAWASDKVIAGTTGSRQIELQHRRRQERINLWWLLTALRGPDLYEIHPETKRASTSTLRGHLCPQLARIANADTNVGIIPTLGQQYMSQVITQGAERFNRHHFANHIDRAIKVMMKVSP